MGLSPQLITADLYKEAKMRLKNLRQDNRAAIRLRAIASAYEHGVNLVAKVFGVSSNTLRAWVKSFAAEDVDGLEYKLGRGRKSHLTSEHLAVITKWTQEDPNITIARIVARLQDEFGLITSKSAVHRALHQLNLSYITPRPVHHKQDKSEHTEFKKKS
jgi:transposase